MPFDLLCLGNPLLDLQADVEAEYLATYDLKADDAILVDPKHMPIFDEVVAKENVHILAGGAAQNTARGAQYILPDNSVVYFGSVGNDKFAAQLREANTKAGVFSNYMVQETIPTGKCAALITGNHRSLVTDLGAANHYKVEHLKAAENWKLVEEAKVYYVGGYHFTVCPEAINTLGEHAASTNKPFCVNLSAPFIPTVFKDALDSSSQYWDFLIGNESEAAAYAESHGLDTSDIEGIAKAIALLPKKNTGRNRTVVFTQGTDETIVVIGDVEKGTTTTQRVPVHPIPGNTIVDSNGAGDAFAGGFVGGLVQGKELLTCVDMGQWLAALSLQQVGPSYPYPKKVYGA
ncbi:adenosine kinase [Trichomonascus vanleenenianus]|uniref:adenosine kinase n=1 Tax=Trichomonascus vanleenenianus TaxID=2268995 RepID=UPI003ECB45B1